MDNMLSNIREALQQHADDETRQSGQRFFKEEVQILGVKSKDLGEIARAHYKMLAEKDKDEIFGLCNVLFQSGMMEEAIIACRWSYFLHKQYQQSDFSIFELWIKNYVNNWAVCDTFCNHTVGSLIIMYPEILSSLKKWTSSENRWVRRGAAVSLIVPARRGLYTDHIFEIADSLLTDSDDMVQKGYGWMLKVAGQTYPDEIFRFVMDRRSVMPRTSLRYAIEKLPARMKKDAMQRPDQ